jgi:hypothetical protein
MNRRGEFSQLGALGIQAPIPWLATNRCKPAFDPSTVSRLAQSPKLASSRVPLAGEHTDLDAQIKAMQRRIDAKDYYHLGSN